jgi:hypothetical protein
MDFKSQIASDMKVFHNAEEFGTMTNVWYQENKYTVPLILDHTEAGERQKMSGDNVDGIYQIDCIVYMSKQDFGIVPRKNRQIEISVDGVKTMYQIEKVDLEDVEIILELRMLDE